MATQLGIVEIYQTDDVSIHGHFISLHEKNVYNPSNKFAASVIMELWSEFGGDNSHPLAEILNKAKDNFNPSPILPYIQKVTFDNPNEDNTNFTIVVKDTSILDFIEGGESWDSYYLG